MITILVFWKTWLWGLWDIRTIEQGSCDPAFLNKIKDYKLTRGALDELFNSEIKMLFIASVSTGKRESHLVSQTHGIGKMFIANDLLHLWDTFQCNINVSL